MKIGFIIYGLDRPLTGIGRFTLEVARAFEQLGADVTLLVSGELGVLSDTSLPHHQLKMARLAPALLTVGSIQLPNVVKRYDLDILHDPIGITPFFFGVGLAKSIVSIHDVIPWSLPEYSSRFDSLVYRRWLPYALPKMDRVITCSNHSKSEIIKYMKVNADLIDVVSYGVDGRFQALPADQVTAYLKTQLNIDFPYVLYVGNLTQRKNIATYLRAFARMKDEFPKHRLVVVGPSTFLSTDLEPVVNEHGLNDRIVLTGPVSEEALPYLYNGADVFGFPSLYEGFGLPPLEAMACGTPVVTSNAASLPEVVGDAALLVEPMADDQMAEALRQILTDTQTAQQLIDKGLARAKQFTWQATANRILDVYRHLL